MKVYPVADRPLLRDPEKGDFVPAEGRTVADSLFWRRRLRDGDASRTQQIFPAAEAVASVVEVVADAVNTIAQDSAETTPAAADESTSAEAE